jgi:DNA polymerase-3 subunit epsilon
MQGEIIKFFYDLETTGVDERKNGIHQISGCIEVDGALMESFNFKVQPNPKAIIDEEALDIGNVTREQINAYPPMRDVYLSLVKLLSKYVDKYNPRDKMYLIGFRNSSFDDKFFRAWFLQNQDAYFGSWFWGNSLDVSIQASEYLINRRAKMLNFKLKTVAKELGLEVDEDRLHDAEYDILLTRDIYRIVSGIEIEL